jgi:short-subunit dehydrogenase
VTYTFKHIVITGASSGLGAALALLYSKPGIRLLLLDCDGERLTCVEEACRLRGCDVATHVGDVTNAQDMESRLIACDSSFPVDLVIANAGIGGHAPKEGETGVAARRLISVNTIGVINTVTPLLHRFAARRRGYLAIVSSLAGFLSLPESPSYCASKAAIRIYGHALRRRFAPEGVRVTVICPGFMETSLAQHLPYQPRGMWSAERSAAYISRGLAHGRREICFPWQTNLTIRAASALPAAIADRILGRLRPEHDRCSALVER